jgi:hypothetical protein
MATTMELAFIPISVLLALSITCSTNDNRPRRRFRTIALPGSSFHFGEPLQPSFKIARWEVVSLRFTGFS